MFAFLHFKSPKSPAVFFLKFNLFIRNVYQTFLTLVSLGGEGGGVGVIFNWLRKFLKAQSGKCYEQQTLQLSTYFY